MTQRNDHARRVLDLARAEAEGFGHRYLGPEHLVLGVLRDGGNGASRVLEAHGVDLPAAREALGRLADRGVVPGPRPSDTELLGSLGMDLDAIRRTTEQSLATGRWGGRSGRRPARDAVGLGGCRGRRCATHQCSSPGAVSRRRAGKGPRHEGDRPELLLLGVVTDVRTPWPRCMNNRWRRQLYASVGLPKGYRGAAGPLLQAFGVDLDHLGGALLAELEAGVP